MITVRLAKNQWAKAWRAMIEVAPVRLIADDPVYEVQPAPLELLGARKFPYAVVKLSGCGEEGSSHRAETVKRIDALRDQLSATYGEMPDSTALLREDRER